jgi:hypothetical protein
MLPQPPRAHDPRSLLTLGRKSESSEEGGGSLARRSEGSTFSLDRWEPVESDGEGGGEAALAALGFGAEDMEVDSPGGARRAGLGLAQLSRSSGGSSTTLDVSLPLPAVPGQAQRAFDLGAVMSSPRSSVVERPGLQGDIAGRLSVFSGRDRDAAPRRQRVGDQAAAAAPPGGAAARRRWSGAGAREGRPPRPQPSPPPPPTRSPPRARPPTRCSCA